MINNSRISKPMKGQIECPVRALIIDNNKILLCRPIDKDYFFLPGGHIEFGEYAKDTLNREIMEELGVGVRKVQSLGFIDNIYDDKDEGMTRHEINLIYFVELLSTKLKLTEEHISFEWVNVLDMEKINLLPAPVKRFIIEWVKK